MASGGRRPMTDIVGLNIEIGRDRFTCRQAAAALPMAMRCSTAMRRLPWRQWRRWVGDRLVGGRGTIATPKPIKTVGSYWPYAPTLFDYIRRAMPQNAPQSLSNDDVYAVSAYILNLNGLLASDATLDARTLSAIKMPNRDMFTGDPRPTSKIRPARKVAEVRHQLAVDPAASVRLRLRAVQAGAGHHSS